VAAISHEPAAAAVGGATKNSYFIAAPSLKVGNFGLAVGAEQHTNGWGGPWAMNAIVPTYSCFEEGSAARRVCAVRLILWLH